MIDRFRTWLRERLIHWLGLDLVLGQLQADLDGHTEIARLMAEQLNRTTLGAADVMQRLAYYEQHVDSVRYAHQKLKAKQNGANGESRIIQLGS